jgi:hypothetical protein
MRTPLIAVALLLLGVLLSQWWSWSPALPSATDDRTVDSVTADTVPSPSEAALEPALPKEEYASVSERPLFLPDRRPPPDEADKVEESESEALTELNGMDLTAVVITPSTVSAWVRRPNAREAERLRLGDQFEGWTVQTIEPDRLVFERQGDTDELILRDYKNAPPPLPRPIPPAARRQPRTQPGRQPPPAGSEDQRTQPTETKTRRVERRPR